MRVSEPKIHISYTFTELIFAIMIFVSSMTLLQIPFHGLTLSIVFQIIIIAWYIISKKEIVLVRDPYYLLVVFDFLLCILLCPLGGISVECKKTSVYMIMLLLPAVLVAMVFNTYEKHGKSLMYIFKASLKAMSITQVIWCYIQFILSRMGVDINRLIFVELLHVVENASAYKFDQYMPSGLSWHPAVMAPIVIISYLLFDNMWIKLLSIGCAAITGNSTALLGIIMCVCLSIIIPSIKRKQIVAKHRVLCILGVLFIIFVVSGAWKIAYDKLYYLFSRVFGVANDDSTIGHIRYYTSYPDVVGISSLLQLLFGWGEGCSGCPINILFNQFPNLSYWAVECDVMNLLISRGVVGFFLYYTWLFRMAFLGYKINYKYVVLVLALIIEGITYNVQFEWLFLFESIIYVLIINNKDIFCETKSRMDRVIDGLYI